MSPPKMVQAAAAVTAAPKALFAVRIKATIRGEYVASIWTYQAVDSVILLEIEDSLGVLQSSAHLGSHRIV